MKIWAIEQSSSIAIASEGNANEKLWFLWRHVKIKKCKSCIINHIHRLKCLISLCFWVELNKALEKDGQEIKISTRMKKFHFWVKNAVLIKTGNEFLKKSDVWYTWSNDHIPQIFQISERSYQYSRRYDILNSHPFWNSIILYRFLSIPSRVLHNSTRKHRKIRHFSRGIWLIIHDLHFFFLILTCLHKIHSFSLALSSEAISIDQLGSIAP